MLSGIRNPDPDRDSDQLEGIRMLDSDRDLDWSESIWKPIRPEVKNVNMEKCVEYGEKNGELASNKKARPKQVRILVV